MLWNTTEEMYNNQREDISIRADVYALTCRMFDYYFGISYPSSPPADINKNSNEKDKDRNTNKKKSTPKQQQSSPSSNSKPMVVDVQLDLRSSSSFWEIVQVIPSFVEGACVIVACN